MEFFYSIKCGFTSYSKSIDRFYIGTSVDPNERLTTHNEQAYGTKHWTAQTGDWELFHSIRCEDSRQALKIEKHIKKMKSREYLANLKKYPEIEFKLRARFST